MKKPKLALSRETIRQLATDFFGHVVGGYLPERTENCTVNCTGNCPPAPTQACITQGCNTYNPECVVRL